MKIKDKHYQTIWYEKNSSLVKIIDQTKLPHEFIIKDIHNADEMVNAIFSMEVRGAPLIGGAAAFGIALATKEKKDLNFIKQKGNDLIKSRPTAINLEWAVNRMINKLINVEKGIEGQVILFPAWVNHVVYPFKGFSGIPRVSISGNIVLDYGIVDGAEHF